jgi:hypothetical protein
MDNQNNNEADNIIATAHLIVKLGLIIIQLKDKISYKALSFLNEGLQMASKEIEKRGEDFKFKQIIKPLEDKDK